MQPFSKHCSWKRGIPESFLGIPQRPNYFHKNSDIKFAILIVFDIGTDGAKAVVGNCGHLSRDQGSSNSVLLKICQLF